MRCVVSVLGKDQTGIVAGVSNGLLECNANIDDISQTILNSLFSMTMLITLDESTATFNEVQEKLAEVGQRLGVQVSLQRQDVFDFMYNV